MVKIKSSKDNRSGRSVKMFVDSKPIIVQFDENCIAEVADDVVLDLLEIDKSLSVIDKEIEKQLKKANRSDNKEIASLQERVDQLAEENKILKLIKEERDNLKEENDNLKKEISELMNGEDKEKKEIIMSKSDLLEMSVKQLKEAAAEADNCPEEEWKRLKKDDLVDYLFNKLNA